MESSSLLSCIKLPPKRFLIKTPSSLRRFGDVRKVVVSAWKSDEYNHGKLVDENMIVLRMRIKEMKIFESTGQGNEAPENWNEWEKTYCAHYNEDVCEVLGLLQTFLMNTRPSLALGIISLIALSLPLSTYVITHNVINMANQILSSFSSS